MAKNVHLNPKNNLTSETSQSPPKACLEFMEPYLEVCHCMPACCSCRWIAVSGSWQPRRRVVLDSSGLAVKYDGLFCRILVTSACRLSLMALTCPPVLYPSAPGVLAILVVQEFLQCRTACPETVISVYSRVITVSSRLQGISTNGA